MKLCLVITLCCLYNGMVAQRKGGGGVKDPWVNEYAQMKGGWVGKDPWLNDYANRQRKGDGGMKVFKWNGKQRKWGRDTKGFSQDEYDYMTKPSKHTRFVTEKMGNKAVTELTGIGSVLGAKLASKGFDKAYMVLGKFLLLKKDKGKFVEWLKNLSGANVDQASDCYQALRDWCTKFL